MSGLSAIGGEGPYLTLTCQSPRPKAAIAGSNRGIKHSLTGSVTEGRLSTYASFHVLRHCNSPSLAFPLGTAAEDVHTLEIRSDMRFEAPPATTGLFV